MSANAVYLVNRAAALSFSDGPLAGLEALLPLETELASYQPFFAAKADILRRAEREVEAEAAYQQAILLSLNSGERALLQSRVTARIILRGGDPAFGHWRHFPRLCHQNQGYHDFNRRQLWLARYCWHHC